MKHFFRSLPGKIILFIGCVVSVTALVGCILGAFILVEGGFYEAGEEELFGREVSPGIISQWQELYNYGQYDENEDGVREYRSDGNLILHIYDEDDACDLCARVGSSADTATEDLKPEYDIVFYSYSSYFEPVWEYSIVRSQYYYYNRGLINDSDNYSFRNFRIKAAFRKGFPANDRYALIYKGIHFGYKMRYAVYYIGTAAGIIALLCFIALMCVSARRKEDDGLHPGMLHKVPFDLIAASESFLIALYIHFIVEFGDRSMAALIAAIIAVRLTAFAIGSMRFGRPAFIHSYLNKAAGAAFFLSPFLITPIGLPATVAIAGIVCISASLEYLLINIRSRDYDPDYRSVFLDKG